MIVRAGIWSPNDHDRVSGCRGGGGVIDAVIIHRWLKEMRVFFEPFRDIQSWGQHCRELFFLPSEAFSHIPD